MTCLAGWGGYTHNNWLLNLPARHCNAIGNIAMLTHFGHIQTVNLIFGAAAQQASPLQYREEGIRKAKEEKPDIVVTDILMPDKEGIETIMELQGLDSKIRIIAMSGGGSAKNMSFLEMAKKVGARHVLSKPFKSAVLLNAVKSLVEY